MQANVCPICDDEFNETNKIPKEMECNCIACERCLNAMYKRNSVIFCLHHNFKSTIPVQQLKTIETKVKNLCQEHQLVLQFICSKDNQLVCSACLITTHNHEFILIQEKIKTLQEENKAKLLQLKETIHLQMQRETLNKAQQQLNESKFANRNVILEANKRISSQVANICQQYFNKYFIQIDGSEQKVLSNLLKIITLQQQISNISQLEEITIDQCELKKQKIENLQELLQSQEQNQQDCNIQKQEN